MDSRSFRQARRSARTSGAMDVFWQARGVNLYQPNNASTFKSATRETAQPYISKRSVASHPAVSQEQTLPKFDMSLSDTERRRRPVFRVNRFRSIRTWVFRTAIALLVLTVGAGSLMAAISYMKVRSVFHGSDIVALQNHTDPNLLNGESDGRVNILLLGNGGGTHEAPDLTDTIMLASIDPVNNKADLLSIPRDLWVNVAGYGEMKINAAYETGKYAYLHRIDESNADYKAVAAGFVTIDRTIEQVLGVDINYNALVNFQAFSQGVNAVGGVTVNVPEELYDPTMAWENNWNPVLAKPGVQTFDGRHALIYVRSRETSSDFARGQRQRAVLVAMKDKVMTLGVLGNPLKMTQLAGAFGDNVRTDLSMSNANRLATLMKRISNDDVKSIGLADQPNSFVTTAAINRQSVVRPVAGLFEYSAIQKFVRSTLVNGYIARENARITVLNGTAKTGLASQRADELKSFGYNITRVGYTPTNNYQSTIIVDLTGGRDASTAKYLQQRFGVALVTELPDKAIQTGPTDFIIVLGNDETFSSPD